MTGYLKFVDFGTAKDLIEVDLNGPEFVGTPEYMCPDTVNVKRSSTVGIEADIWALGVILYQMVLGYIPFAAPSPFLTFLRIERAKLEVMTCIFRIPLHGTTCRLCFSQEFGMYCSIVIEQSHKIDFLSINRMYAFNLPFLVSSLPFRFPVGAGLHCRLTAHSFE